MDNENMNTVYTYLVQIIFILGIALGSNNLNFDDKHKWLGAARYILYLLTIKCIPELCRLAHRHYSAQSIDARTLIDNTQTNAILYINSLALLLYFDQSLFREDFIHLFLAFLVVKYPEMCAKSSISYGAGMACSFFEGYLMHVLPSDGARFVGFEENIRGLEAAAGIYFPVKKLFIITTKSLYCPPDLKEFNRNTDDSPYLEAFGSLEDVVKNVAGVKDRQYRNTAYKIYRGPGAPPVPLAAECATPLHTLHRVINNRALYDEVTEIDVATVVADFTSTLNKIIDKSPQCRGKCELVYYDNEDPSQNLAEILLKRIEELEPKFEEKILARRNDNIIQQ